MAMQSTESKSRLWGTYVAIMIPLGVAINYVGGLLNSALGGPLYLDSIGTAVVAAVMGFVALVIPCWTVRRISLMEVMTVMEATHASPPRT